MKKIKLFLVLFFIGSLCLPTMAPTQTGQKAQNQTKKALSAKKNGKYPDGSLLRVKGTPGVYLIQNGKKNPFPDPTTFVAKGYKWENVKDVDPAVLKKIPMGTSIPAVVTKKK